MSKSPHKSAGGIQVLLVCPNRTVKGDLTRQLSQKLPNASVVDQLNYPSRNTLGEWLAAKPSVCFIDMNSDREKSMALVADSIQGLVTAQSAAPYIVVWGVSVTEAEALRLLQAGARGVVRKAADLVSLSSCMRAVSGGASWMESSVFDGLGRGDRKTRSQLTPREQQVKELVEQGLKNREVGHELGIRPGTVKIHLKHIFEKTGVRGRYGLALTGLQDAGQLHNAGVL